MAGRRSPGTAGIRESDDSATIGPEGYAPCAPAAIVLGAKRGDSKDVQQAGAHSSRSHLQISDGHRQLEPSRTGTSGIYVKHAFTIGEARAMRVTGNDHPKSSRGGVQVELLDVVD